jgi:hypothetical protein
MAEKIIGMINSIAREANGFTTVFFTETKMIFAKTASFLGMLGTAGGAEILGLGTVLGSQIVTYVATNKSDEKAKELSKLNTDDILKNNKGNFEILYSDVKSITLKRPVYKTIPFTKSQFLFSGGFIEIATTQKHYLYESYATADDFEKYIEVVKTILPDKLTVK